MGPLLPLLGKAASYAAPVLGYSLLDYGIRKSGGSAEEALAKRAQQENFAQRRAMGMLVQGERYLREKRRRRRDLMGGDEGSDLMQALGIIDQIDRSVPEGDDSFTAAAILDQEAGPGFAERVAKAALEGERNPVLRAMGIRR